MGLDRSLYLADLFFHFLHLSIVGRILLHEVGVLQCVVLSCPSRFRTFSSARGIAACVWRKLNSNSAIRGTEASFSVCSVTSPSFWLNAARRSCAWSSFCLYCCVSSSKNCAVPGVRRTSACLSNR